MEIPIQIMCFRIRNSLHCTFKRFFDRLLVTFLIDEIHKPHLIVNPGLLSKMKSKGRDLVASRHIGEDRARGHKTHENVTYSFRHIHDLQIRLVSQVVDFRPEDGNATAHLHETQSLSPFDSSSHMQWLTSSTIQRIQQHKLFRFVIVCCVARGVYTSSKVPCSSAVSRPTRNQAEEKIPVVDVRLPHFHSCVRKGISTVKFV